MFSSLFVNPPIGAVIGTVGTIQDASPLAAAPAQRVAVDWSVLVPLIFAGIALLITTTFSAWASFRAKTIGQNNSEKADTIHGLVNGNLSKALSDVAAAREEVRVLRELVAALNLRIAGVTPAPAIVIPDRRIKGDT